MGREEPALSNFVKSLFKPPLRRRELSGKSRLFYVFLGLLAAISLATAYWSTRQVLHQIGTSVGIYGMILLGAIGEIRSSNLNAYRRNGGLFQDIAVASIWTVLLVVWILDTVGQKK